MTIFVLVRHGENEWVREHRLAGWIEGIHLNENGRKQAIQASARLAHLPLTAIYTSPVARCVETAAILAQPHLLTPIVNEAFGEVRYGEWEGEKIEELAKQKLWHVVQHFPSRLRFPGGEALREVQFRAIQALEVIAEEHPRELVVVCSHADLIKLVLAHYLGVHLDLFQRIAVAPASASVLHLGKNGQVRILRLNDDGPLQPPDKPEEKTAGQSEPGSNDAGPHPEPESQEEL